MKCPKCGEKLQRIDVGLTEADTKLWLKDKVYVPAHTILEFSGFSCPHCEESLEEDDVPFSPNLRYFCADALHKSVLIDAQTLPFNIKEVEFQEELERALPKFVNVPVPNVPAAPADKADYSRCACAGCPLFAKHCKGRYAEGKEAP